jgi:hypothetical protein
MTTVTYVLELGRDTQTFIAGAAIVAAAVYFIFFKD